MSQLISVIYASSAVNLFSEQELVDLLRISRENNKRDDITGLLLYQGGNFIQAIEGPEEAIEQLYQKILKDPRHKNIMLLGKEPIFERQFADWAMGFQNMSQLSPEALKGFSPFMNYDFSPASFHDNPIRAYIMLDSFKKYM